MVASHSGLAAEQRSCHVCSHSSSLRANEKGWMCARIEVEWEKGRVHCRATDPWAGKQRKKRTLSSEESAINLVISRACNLCGENNEGSGTDRVF